MRQSEQNARQKKTLTLAIVHKHPRVLLGMKKRGFGKGRWNGFGGKVRPGEAVEAAAARELFEEAGINAASLAKGGVIEFSFEGQEELLEVHVFKVTDFFGEPRESEEMRPRWFFMDEIPFREMWPDDVYWFPLFLRDIPFRGEFRFADGGGTKLLDSKVVPVPAM